MTGLSPGSTRTVQSPPTRFFNADGTIQKGDPGAAQRGLSERQSEIQIDATARPGVGSVAGNFLDMPTPCRLEDHLWQHKSIGQFNGWTLARRAKSIQVRASRALAACGIRLSSAEGLARPREGGQDRRLETLQRSGPTSAEGCHDIVVTQTGGKAVEVDWVSFQ